MAQYGLGKLVQDLESGQLVADLKGEARKKVWDKSRLDQYGDNPVYAFIRDRLILTYGLAPGTVSRIGKMNEIQDKLVTYIRSNFNLDNVRERVLESTKHYGYYQVSWGTLRIQDLVGSAISFLEDVGYPLTKNVRAEYETYYDPSEDLIIDYLPGAIGKDARDGEEQLGYLWEEIINKLDDICPEGFFFGTSEGDGSAFGYWPIDEDDQDLEDETEQENQCDTCSHIACIGRDTNKYPDQTKCHITQ